MCVKILDEMNRLTDRSTLLFKLISSDWLLAQLFILISFSLISSALCLLNKIHADRDVKDLSAVSLLMMGRRTQNSTGAQPIHAIDGGAPAIHLPWL